MNEKFRSKVGNLAEKGIRIIDSFFDDNVVDEKRLQAAIKTMTLGVKVEHMNQLKAHGDKSLALRLMNYLPKDDETRRRYLQMTNPEVIKLLPRPKIKKK